MINAFTGRYVNLLIDYILVLQREAECALTKGQIRNMSPSTSLEQ